jgi:hypothetical protein
LAAAKLLSGQGSLTGPDLVATFVERWVLPLASRAYKIGLMSGPRGPTHFSTRWPSRAQVIERVNIITNSKLLEGWEYGMEVYTRFQRFPQVKFFSAGCPLLVFVSCFLLMRGSCVQRFNCQKIDAAEGSEDIFLPDLPLSEVEDEDEAEVDEGAQSGSDSGGDDDEDDDDDDDDDDHDARGVGAEGEALISSPTVNRGKAPAGLPEVEDEQGAAGSPSRRPSRDPLVDWTDDEGTLPAAPVG